MCRCFLQNKDSEERKILEYLELLEKKYSLERMKKE